MGKFSMAKPKARTKGYVKPVPRRITIVELPSSRDVTDLTWTELSDPSQFVSREVEFGAMSETPAPGTSWLRKHDRDDRAVLYRQGEAA